MTRAVIHQAISDMSRTRKSIKEAKLILNDCADFSSGMASVQPSTILIVKAILGLSTDICNLYWKDGYKISERTIGKVNGYRIDLTPKYDELIKIVDSRVTGNESPSEYNKICVRVEYERSGTLPKFEEAYRILKELVRKYNTIMISAKDDGVTAVSQVA